jgi:hypothetical protein
LANAFPFSGETRNVSMKRICTLPFRPPEGKLRRALSPLPSVVMLPSEYRRV